MSNFKPNEKVVFIGVKRPHPRGISPMVNEIVTIKCLCDTYPGHYELKEYPVDVFVRPQSFKYWCFRKLSDFLASQSESELTEIEKEFKPVKELELV